MNEVTTREKALAVVFAIVATAILIELGFKVLGPDYHKFNNMLSEYPDNPRGYFDLLRNDGDGAVYGIRMNASEGLGGRVPEAGRSPTTFNILGLGDSQAQGQGVRYADTMYAQVGAIMQESGQHARVKNVAVSGYDLNEIVSRYAYEAKDPGEYEWVLYAMVLDDFGLDRTQITGQDFIQHQPGYTYDRWRARSATYNFFIHIAEQWELSQTTTTAYLDSYRGDNLQRQTEKLNALASSIKADGGQLVVIILPLLYDFEHYPFGEIHSTMTDWGRDNGIEVIDGFDVLSEHKASDLWVHAIDHHPNEIAHRLIAEAIVKRISTAKK